MSLLDELKEKVDIKKAAVDALHYELFRLREQLAELEAQYEEEHWATLRRTKKKQKKRSPSPSPPPAAPKKEKSKPKEKEHKGEKAKRVVYTFTLETSRGERLFTKSITEAKLESIASPELFFEFAKELKKAGLDANWKNVQMSLEPRGKSELLHSPFWAGPIEGLWTRKKLHEAWLNKDFSPKWDTALDFAGYAEDPEGSGKVHLIVHGGGG